MAWYHHEPLLKTPKTIQWGALLILSVLMAALLMLAKIPAAFMLGPMIAGILVETGGGELRVPASLMLLAQGVIGCLVARAITLPILSEFSVQWPLFLTIMLSVIAASCVIGWVVSRVGLLPGTTAIWGLIPGAASVMMLMADAFGADGRLVAFIQYLRVVFVAILASILARFFFHTAGKAVPLVLFPAIHWAAFTETLVFIVISVMVGKRSRIPAGAILVPLMLGAVLHLAGLLPIELPQWLLSLSFALLGANTGLRFTRKILLHALRVLPQILLSISLMVGFCGVLAWVLVKVNGTDPLTAYLATSPGGLDTAAIIAASTKVDMPFVMAMQVVRLLIVLLVGPSLSRLVAGRVAKTREAE